MNKFYLSFHVGRGGHFNNPGFLTYVDEEDFQDLLHRRADILLFIDTHEDDNTPLPDEEVKLLDTSGNEILRGRDAIEDKVGTLDFDGRYNTDYVVELGDLNDQELEAVWQAYLDRRYMSDELKDALCTAKGLLRSKDIKRIASTILITTQKEGDNQIRIDFDQMEGVFTRKEWEVELDDHDWKFCPVSVEAILDYMDTYCYTNDTDFFAEAEEEND